MAGVLPALICRLTRFCNVTAGLSRLRAVVLKEESDPAKVVVFEGVVPHGCEASGSLSTLLDHFAFGGKGEQSDHCFIKFFEANRPPGVFATGFAQHNNSASAFPQKVHQIYDLPGLFAKHQIELGGVLRSYRRRHGSTRGRNNAHSAVPPEAGKSMIVLFTNMHNL
jgi:hypothetical protein